MESVGFDTILSIAEAELESLQVNENNEKLTRLILFLRSEYSVEQLVEYQEELIAKLLELIEN